MRARRHEKGAWRWAPLWLVAAVLVPVVGGCLRLGLESEGRDDSGAGEDDARLDADLDADGGCGGLDADASLEADLEQDGEIGSDADLEADLDADERCDGDHDGPPPPPPTMAADTCATMPTVATVGRASDIDIVVETAGASNDVGWAACGSMPDLFFRCTGLTSGIWAIECTAGAGSTFLVWNDRMDICPPEDWMVHFELDLECGGGPTYVAISGNLSFMVCRDPEAGAAVLSFWMPI